jgi:hypothetical protein
VKISSLKKIIIIIFIIASNSVSSMEKKLPVHVNDFELSSKRLNVLKLIDKYKEELNSEKSHNIMLRLIKFTEESDLVIVKIYTDDMPFEYNLSKSGNYFKLYGAFIVGNIEYQLRNNIKINSRISGVNMLYKVYRKIREKDRTFKLPDIMNWLRKKRSLQLK